MQFIDAPESPIRAMNEGRLKVSKLEELRLMEEYIEISPERVEEINKRGEELYGDTANVVKTDQVVNFYVQALADLIQPPKDWKVDFAITLFNPDDAVIYKYCLKVADGQVSVSFPSQESGRNLSN